MPPKLNSEAEKRLQNAIEFRTEYPTEKGATASRIFKINDSTLRSRMRRSQIPNAKPHGGHNKVLSDTQTKAIQQYI